MGVIGGYGVQTSVLVESLGAVGFIVNVMCDLLQVLEVRPERERWKEVKGGEGERECEGERER